MVVEDDEASREALSRRLERRGYRMVTAMNGLDAVAMAQAKQPALILMDLGLPGIDGLEATSRLKSDGATRHIPIVVLSAHAMTSYRKMALDAGADDFDTKPVRFQQLLRKIESLLTKAGVHQ